MIKLTGINKYYFKNKSNEIHVLDNVSLDFPETGLVALLGKSGSGKTTLLNVMSGLDDADKGIIQLDSTILKSYNSKVWDALRSRKIGYVFQNYNLFNDKTVYENLEMALNLAGLYDKAEIDARINYSLELVGLAKYKKRRPSSLSGGQQQRVGIARALVKSPSVIIADEPTGNLDSRNTFEVMDKLKSISKFCLVVLVTHEQQNAEFFADRIIQLQDGRVIEDTVNQTELNMDVREKSDIYLKDLKNSKGKFGEKLNIQYYFEKEPTNDINIEIVEHDGRIYLKATSPSTPITLVNDKSEVRLLDENYKMKSSTEHKSVEIDRNILGPIQNAKKGSAIKTSVAFRNAFRKYFSIPRKKKRISNLLLEASAFLFVLAIAFGANTLIFDKSTYTRDTRLLTVYSNDYTIEEATDFIGDDGIEYVIVNSQISSIYIDPIAYSTPGSITDMGSNAIGGNIFNVDLYPFAAITGAPELIAGSASTPGINEAIIDLTTAEEALTMMKTFGINRIDFLINEKIKVESSSGVNINETYTIVGIVDSGINGAWINNTDFEALMTACEGLSSFSIITSDKDATSDKFSGAEIISDPYQDVLDTFNAVRRLMGYIIGGVTLAITFVVISATNRNVKAGFIDRIKEIGTYRCIGASKRDISKEFIFESLITTTLSSFLGFVVGSYAVREVAKALASYPLGVIGFFYPLWLLIIVGILVYGINLLISIIRVNKLMFSTPAQIMAKYDI